MIVSMSLKGIDHSGLNRVHTTRDVRVESLDDLRLEAVRQARMEGIRLQGLEVHVFGVFTLDQDGAIIPER